MAAMEQVAKDHKQTLVPLTDDLPLLVSGLDSLSLAVLVVRIEDELNLDPFNTSDAVNFPLTFRDFVAAYENAAKSVPIFSAPASSMSSSAPDTGSLPDGTEGSDPRKA
jgi:hypothetical protein